MDIQAAPGLESAHSRRFHDFSMLCEKATDFTEDESSQSCFL